MSYGWTDKQIGELTLSRFLQITAAIRRREFWATRQEKSLVSWSTRTLATFIAAGYMSDPKKGNPGLDAAVKLAIDEIEAAQLTEVKEAPQKAPEPTVGSFERFSVAFGGKLQFGGDEE